MLTENVLSNNLNSMSTREESLARIDAAVDRHVGSLRHARSATNAKGKIASFGEETIKRLDVLFSNEDFGEEALIRTLALLGTMQVKNLESVVRNIIIFAEVEKLYVDKLGLPTLNSWRLFKGIEKYAHTRVCGVHNAMETPAQAKQMVAVFQAALAIAQNFAFINGFPDLDSYVILLFLSEGNLDKASGMIEVFQQHPQEAERLFDFVASRGVVDPKLLEAVVFFGDDLPSSVFSGVL